MKIQFIAKVVKWFDKVNGNTYHSVSIRRCSDGKFIYCPFTYGYGDHYRQTALEAMLKAGWLGDKYNEKNAYLFERENDYCIDWNVANGLKRECMENGIK